MFNNTSYIEKNDLDREERGGITRPVSQFFFNDLRGVNLKIVHEKLGKIESRIAEAMVEESDNTRRSNLSCLQRSVKQARELATVVWDKVQSDT